jgi:hypothetical protein
LGGLRREKRSEVVKEVGGQECINCIAFLKGKVDTGASAQNERKGEMLE